MKNVNNTGVKIVNRLQLVYESDNSPVLDSKGKIITKANTPGTQGYIAPYLDYSDCPTMDSPVYPPEKLELCKMDDVTISVIDGVVNDSGDYIVVVGVNKTDTVYEFLNPITGVWAEATVGKNRTVFTVPAEGQTLNITVRKTTCDVTKSLNIQVPEFVPTIPLKTTIVTGYDCQSVAWYNATPKLNACGKDLGPSYEACVVYVKQINNCDASWRWIPDSSIPSGSHSLICNC